MAYIPSALGTDPEIWRFLEKLTEAEKEARQALLDAGFDVGKLEAESAEPPSFSTGKWEIMKDSVFIVDSDIPGAEKLFDETNPVHYAFNMLRWVRLAREAIDDAHTRNVDLLPMVYCFNLGTQFRRAQLGLVFPEIEASFHKRRQRSAAATKRPHPLRPIVEAIYSELEASGVRPGWRRVARKLEEQGGSLQKSTLRNWLTEIRKNNSR